ncbi:amidohydrolase [Sulfoacidibacillus thermotolerans]|uniref:5-methylthioadenosine/S-adenosylhomocysteine deaminase n=1 Tax=Sulfoacidibacillus thermotolerans TaxID=1765684 RepID=A0A2U3D724_SULT2|nr:amidohydrolase [Sulfoacidibacillus thermotolerans]PWI57078.1 N-ethylammeline chlorohydrolase [Sulfoacidibacillus thermotolerans]
MNWLIENVAYFDGIHNTCMERGYVLVRDGKIEALGAGEAPLCDASYERIDGKDRLLLPGFINTHGHAAMSLLRGYADDLPLHTWLKDLIWPAEAVLSPDDIELGTELAMLEMLETGTTTFTDMYADMDRVANATIRAGMRAVLGRGLIGFDDVNLEKLAESESFVRMYEGAGEGLIHTTFAPHAPYTCPPDYLKHVITRSQQLAVPLQIHIAETAKEVADSYSEYGKSPVELLYETGLFECQIIGAHCVHLTDRDIELMAEHHVHVAHNPGSNLKLGSGIAPLRKLLEQNIVVGLGTDGAASNNKLDLYEELRLVALLHKGVEQDATAIDAFSALRLVTNEGAKTLFLDPMLGTLQPGAPADFQFIDISGPRYYPRHNLLSHIVYSSHGGDVTDVFVAGKPLFRKREHLTLDKEKVFYNVKRVVQKFPLSQRVNV